MMLEGTMAQRISLVVFLALSAAPAVAQTGAEKNYGIQLVQNWVATTNADAGQCNGAAHGRIVSPATEYSPAIKMDTDGRPGGCKYQMGIVDPSGELAKRGFKLTMDFWPDGEAGQCGSPGPRQIPVSRSLGQVKLSDAIVIDTDNRPGGCRQRWSMAGHGVAFDMKFWAEGEPGQCKDLGNYSIAGGQQVEIGIDTDNAPGGCLQSLRLRIGPSAAAVASQQPAPAIAAKPPSSEKRVALVIGNAKYRNIAPLANPENDARLMAATLRGLGFTLVGGDAQIDLDKAALDSLVQKYSKEIQGADVALLYYAGHGVQVRGNNYFVPINANPTREADVDFEMTDVNVVLRQMQVAGTRLNLMILDACRNNPFGGGGLRATSGGLAQMQAPEGTLISYATQPGNVAQDGNDGNSPFAKALAQTVRKPGLGIFDAFNEVGLAVMKATGDAQQPWVSSSPIKGSFFFAGAPARQ
jgi:hypothetical protein